MNYQEIYYNAYLSDLVYLHQNSVDKFLKGKEGASVRFNDDNDHYIHFRKESKVYVTIKGTSNLENVIYDLEYKKVFNNLLNCWVHEGFFKTSKKIYEDLIKIYSPEDEIHLTGHSYGGAVAAILGMLLKNSHYKVHQIITFGQPKVTNDEGCKYFDKLPLIRVIHHNDPVTTVPPHTPWSWFDHGFYKHFGTMVRIKKDLSVDIAKNGSISFWHYLSKLKLDDHRMNHYLKVCKKLTK